MEFINVLENFGVAVACLLGLGYYFVQKDKANREDINRIIENLREDSKEDRNMYRETIGKFDDKLDKFAIALETNNNELKVIKDDIKTIKETVGV